MRRRTRSPLPLVLLAALAACADPAAAREEAGGPSTLILRLSAAEAGIVPQTIDSIGQSGTTERFNPDVSGNWVVWTRGEVEVMARNLVTGEQLSLPKAGASDFGYRDAAIEGDLVAYRSHALGSRGGQPVVYDLAERRQILVTPLATGPDQVSRSRDRLALSGWQLASAEDGTVVTFGIVREQIHPGRALHTLAAGESVRRLDMSERIILWEVRSAAGSRFMMHDLWTHRTTEVATTAARAAADEGNWDLWNGLLVFTAGGRTSMHVRDLAAGTERQVTGLPAETIDDPRASGGYVAWRAGVVDDALFTGYGPGEIWVAPLSGGAARRITDDPRVEGGLQFSGGKRLVWHYLSYETNGPGSSIKAVELHATDLP